ncbi:hypothetical protein D3OALGA1CA_5376 [Olavius algarvensis associated proteobacterium Delta 3]|nr:hypothetical protein D3OALGB2SA_1523 [Olavius algarvensis associated proteobacterium Delta 3]CAB5165825.1 hypothetical protein D3OALGA1CA_5376 [Olavius algarvensis associated proteobacterium Delta 3]
MYTDTTAFDVHLKTAHFLDVDSAVKEWVGAKKAKMWYRQYG